MGDKGLERGGGEGGILEGGRGEADSKYGLHFNVMDRPVEEYSGVKLSLPGNCKRSRQKQEEEKRIKKKKKNRTNSTKHPGFPVETITIYINMETETT